MRKRSDKDNSAGAGIASANSTVNLFLGAQGKTRAWMNASSSSSSAPISPPAPAKRRRSEVLPASSGGISGDNRSQATRLTLTKQPQSTTTVLPSPAPSDEPSPAQETSPNRVTLEERIESAGTRATASASASVMELDAAAGGEGGARSERSVGRAKSAAEIMEEMMAGGVRSSAEIMEDMMALRGKRTGATTQQHQEQTMGPDANTNTAGQDTRSLGLQRPSMMGQRRVASNGGQAGQSPAAQTQQQQTMGQPAHTNGGQTVQSPGTQQQHTNNEGQTVQSPATQTQQHPIMGQPAHTNSEAPDVQNPGTQQQPIMVREGQTNAGGQAVQSPSSQQPPMTQRNIPTVSQGAPVLTHHGHPYAGQQPLQSPSTQQPPPMSQQSNANGPQPVQRPSMGPVGPVPSAKKRKMTSANHPSLKGMLPIIEYHLNMHGGMQGLTKIIERQRFQMLQRACDSDDYFYVALHQMFCLWSIDPDLTTKLTMPEGKTVLESSFAIIGQLIMANRNISPVHTKFFSMFPNHLSELMYRSDQYIMTVNNVSIFLARLSLEWAKYVPECAQRGYPPLVDELVNRFGILSPTLQHIFFTATRRNIGCGDDEYGARMEELFTNDQEQHRKMAARVNTAYPPTEREINERNQWQANQYTNLSHMQAQKAAHNNIQAQQAAHSNMQTRQMRQIELAQTGLHGTHPIQPNFPGHIQSPSNMPSATQAPIRTNVMPSEVLTASPQSVTLPSQHHPWPSPAASEHSLRSPMSFPILPSQVSQGYPILPSQQNMQQPYPPNEQSMQQQYQQAQMQNMQQRQGQVNDVVRTASRNASRNASLSQFSGAGSAATSPVLATPVRRGSSSPYSNVAPTIASMPAGHNMPQQQQPQPQQQQQQQVTRIPLIPPVGYVPPYQFPQPDRSALHQAHLRSPVLRPVDTNEGLPTKESAPRYYQAVQSFPVNPTTLLDPPKITELSFIVPLPTFHNIAQDKLSDPTAPMLREVREGSIQYRVRCTRVDKGTGIHPSDFVVADTNWPPTIFMEMNDSVLEIRRKSHYGKDRPVDITPHVFDCGPGKENVLRISVPKHPKSRSDKPYAVAIEAVEIFKHQQIVDMCLKKQRITAKQTINDIKAKLTNSKADEDDDVALVSANLTIDLADPFTARIFTTPVRGVRCRHRECFDLETFLISRSTKPQEVACLPDVWKCPLCGGDASPRSLRVDEFLVSVREKLERNGELDVKAILVDEDGEWTVKPEAPPAVRKKSRGGNGSVPRDDGEHGSPDVPSRQASRVVEVIEVDDD